MALDFNIGHCVETEEVRLPCSRCGAPLVLVCRSGQAKRARQRGTIGWGKNCRACQAARAEQDRQKRLLSKNEAEMVNNRRKNAWRFYRQVAKTETAYQHRPATCLVCRGPAVGVVATKLRRFPHCKTHTAVAQQRMGVR